MAQLNATQMNGLLDRITERLAVATESAKLQTVLETLLPQLLQLLGFPEPTIRTRVMSLVTHVHQRLKADPSVQLPVAKVFALWSSSMTQPFVANFSLMYLKMGFERAAPSDKATILPQFIRGLAQRSNEQSQALLDLILQGILCRTVEYKTNRASSGTATTAPTQESDTMFFEFYRPSEPALFAQCQADVSALFQHFLRLFLYPPGTTLAAKTPPGLSTLDVRLVLNNRASLATADVVPLKLAVLNLIKAHLKQHIQQQELTPDQERWVAQMALPVVLVAGHDPHHEVISLADPLLKQYVEPALKLHQEEDSLVPTPDSTAPTSTVVHALYGLILGNVNLASDVELPIDQKRTPAPEAIQLKALSILCRSTAAARFGWPYNYWVLKLCLEDFSESRKLLSSGLQFLMWIMRAFMVVNARQELLQGTPSASPTDDLDMEASAQTPKGSFALDQYAPQILDLLSGALRRLQESMLRPNTTVLKNSLYLAVGHLSRRCPSLHPSNENLIQLFLNDLQHSSNIESANTIREALTLVCVALWSYSNVETSEFERCKGRLEQLFLQQRSGSPSSQLAAVECTNRLLEFERPASRFLCLALSPSPVQNVREEANKGLELAAFLKHQSAFLTLCNLSAGGRMEKLGGNRYPKFEAFMGFLESQRASIWENAETPLAMKTNLIHFAFCTLVYESYGWSQNQMEVDGEQSPPGTQLPDEILGAYIHKTFGATPATDNNLSAFARFTTLLHDVFTASATSLLAELRNAKPISMLAVPSQSFGSSSVSSGHSSTLTPLQMLENCVLLSSLMAVQLLNTTKKRSPTSNEHEGKSGILECFFDAPVSLYETVRCLLFASSKVVRECAGELLGAFLPTFSVIQQRQCVAELAETHTKLKDTRTADGLDTLHGAILGLASVLCSMSQTGGLEKDPLDVLREIVSSQWLSLLAHPLPLMISAVCSAIGRLGRTGVLNSLVTDLSSIFQSLFTLIKSHSNFKVVESALSCLGDIGMALAAGPILDQLVSGLFEVAVPRLTSVTSTSTLRSSEPKRGADAETASQAMGFSSNEELHFSLGEAFGSILAGSSLNHNHQPRVDSVINKLLRRIFREFVVHRIPIIRRASAIWLMCIVELLCSTGQPPPTSKPSVGNTAALEIEQWMKINFPTDLADYERVKFRLMFSARKGGATGFSAHLIDFQKAFLFLLMDSNEVTQEVATKGLTLVYNSSDPQKRAELDQLLVDVLLSGMKGKVPKIAEDPSTSKQGQNNSSEDQAVLFPSEFLQQLPSSSNTNAGHISTYKDICNLAVEMGTPDMISQLMAVVSHHTLWSSRRAAAFGVANILKVNTGSLRSNLQLILPKLFRNRYDPNPQIASAMQSLWESLLPTFYEQRKAVGEHLQAISKEIVAGLNASQHRIREASCGAFTELLKGRDWEQLEGFVVQALPMLFLVMDDVKDTTRLCAVSTAKNVRNFIVRCCTFKLEQKATVCRCIEAVLPVILEKGLGDTSKQRLIVEYSADLLAQICRVGEIGVKPYIAKIVVAALQYMSILEDVRLQYLQNVGHEQLTTDMIEQVRAKLNDKSALAETIDLCLPHCDHDVILELIPHMIDLLQSGVGLPTRASTARVLGLLAKYHGPSMAPFLDRLLDKCLSVLKHETSLVVKQSLAVAIALIVRSATASTSFTAFQELQFMYVCENTVDDYGDNGIRHAVALTLNECSNHAGDQLRHEQLLSVVLPMAKLGSYDPNEKSSELWKEVWISLSGGDRAGVVHFYPQIFSLITDFLNYKSWAARKQAAKCLNAIASQSHLDQPALLAELLRILMDFLTKYGFWEGKESLLEAVASFFEKCCFVSGVTATAPEYSKETAPAQISSFRPQLLQCIDMVLKETASTNVTHDYRYQAFYTLCSLLRSTHKHKDVAESSSGGSLFASVLDSLLAYRDQFNESKKTAMDLDECEDKIHCQLLFCMEESCRCCVVSSVDRTPGDTNGVKKDVVFDRVLRLMMDECQECSVVSTRLAVWSILRRLLADAEKHTISVDVAFVQSIAEYCVRTTKACLPNDREAKLSLLRLLDAAVPLCLRTPPISSTSSWDAPGIARFLQESANAEDRVIAEHAKPMVEKYLRQLSL